MTWFKVDDGFYDHPKVLAALDSKHGKGAIALWTLCGSWCGKHETDGVVPALVAKRLGGTTQEVELLLTVRLWSRVDGGFTFHGWSERNPLKDALETKRERTRKRVADWRAGTAGNAVTPPVTNSVANAAPVPTRPDPSRPDHKIPPIPPPGGGTPELPDADPETFRAPPVGGAPAAEVREGWGEAWHAAGAGAPPRLVGSVLASAVAFAGDVARAHGKPLREAARAIASAALQAPGSDPTWHLTRLDPFAAPRAAQGPLASLPEQIQAAEAELQAAAARKAPTPELAEIAGRLKTLKARRDEREERNRYARR